jgi:hypothetical protein
MKENRPTESAIPGQQTSIDAGRGFSDNSSRLFLFVGARGALQSRPGPTPGEISSS